MRRLLVVLLFYVTVQAVTSVDPALRASWLVFLLLGAAAWSGTRAGRGALELGLWLRIMAVPALFFNWGSTLDVLGPGVACALFAYGIWRLAQRRWWTFIVPLSLPATALLLIKFSVMPHFFTPAMMAAHVQGQMVVAQQPLPLGWIRYHCPGYSIAVPLGMTSGSMGDQRANMFSFRGTLPAGETLSSLALVFPRPTAFEYDPEIASMAAQILGVSCERDYARCILNASDGYMFLFEKVSWIGLTPPERIEELFLKGASGFLISEPRVNWFRARLYFEFAGRDCQTDIWFYGNGVQLTRDRVLQHLATVRIDPEERNLPTLDDCRVLAMGRSAHHANVVLSSLLSADSRNYEALYLLGLTQRQLGWTVKADEARDHLLFLCDRGHLDTATLAAWTLRYGSLR